MFDFNLTEQQLTLRDEVRDAGTLKSGAAGAWTG
jgi:hypothetical protein